MADFKHWVDYGVCLQQGAAQAVGAATKKQRLAAMQTDAANLFSSFCGRYSGRGFCACAQVLLSLPRISTCPWPVQQLHMEWCSSKELEPFARRSLTSYAQLIREAESSVADDGDGGDPAWLQTTRASAASQLSLNTRRARSGARGDLVTPGRMRHAAGARPDRHIQRQEQAAFNTAQRVRAAARVRKERSDRLKKILLSGDFHCLVTFFIYEQRSIFLNPGCN